jgi:hypothetical protein
LEGRRSPLLSDGKRKEGRGREENRMVREKMEKARREEKGGM